MDKKKLLIVSDNFLPRWDGVARFLVEVLPKLSKEYEITVIAPDFPGSSAHFPDVDIVRCKLSPLTINDFPVAYPIYKKLKPYINQNDIIWVQTIGPLCSSAIYLAKKYKKPLVSYVHSIDWELVARSLPAPQFIKQFAEWATKKVARWLYSKCDILMVPTQEVADIFEYEKINVPKVLVPLAVNVDKFCPPKNKGDSKTAIGISEDDLVIGYCGRVSRDKDLITLYRAFQWLKKKRDNIKLLIVGPGIPEYMNLFESKPDIIATGAKDNVIPYYQAMDIYVLPSLTETTALAAMEAMSCGCCIVSTKVGISQIVIKNNENGMFFPKHNDFILKKKLNWLLHHPEKMELFGKRVRSTIVKFYSWGNTIKGVEGVLDKF